MRTVAAWHRRTRGSCLCGAEPGAYRNDVVRGTGTLFSDPPPSFPGLPPSASRSGPQNSPRRQSFMYSRWRLVAFNLEGVLARACALPELVHVPAEAAASLDALSKEVNRNTGTGFGFRIARAGRHEL